MAEIQGLSCMAVVVDPGKPLLSRGGIRIDIPVWNAAAHKFSEDLETRIRMQVMRSAGSIVSQVQEEAEDKIYLARGRRKQETEEKPRKYFGQHLHVPNSITQYGICTGVAVVHSCETNYSCTVRQYDRSGRGLFLTSLQLSARILPRHEWPSSRIVSSAVRFQGKPKTRHKHNMILASGA